MNRNTESVALSKKEFDLVKDQLVEVPEKTYDKIMSIAKAVFDSGISEDRLADVFREVCRRL